MVLIITLCALFAGAEPFVGEEPNGVAGTSEAAPRENEMRRESGDDGVREEELRSETGKLPPSASVVIATETKTLRERHRGAGPDSLYHWWSVTKIATALAVLELAERGFVDLDAPIVDVLPFLGDFEDGERWRLVSPRMLLTHTAGVKDPMPAMFGWIHFPGDRQPAEESTVRRAAEPRSALRGGPLPAQYARYSNIGYVVLGALVEKVTGSPYGEAVRRLVLDPAGMNGTDVAYPPDSGGRLVAGSHPRTNFMTPLLPWVVKDYKKLVSEKRDGRLWFNPFYTDYLAPTGLIGPARDGVLLARAWAARAKKSDLISGALSTRIPSAGGSGRGPAQTVGWRWSEEGYFFHRGGGPGFGAELRWYPPNSHRPEGLYAFAVGNDTTFDYGRLLDVEIAAAKG
jgi:CubicO group peptidase (beta-lactamase class C family)